MTTRPILGVIVLGHSTGSGVERMLATALPNLRLRVQGALDGMVLQEIADLARRQTEQHITVRLLDGSTRDIGVEWLHPLVQRTARELAAEGAGAVLLAHGSDFPDCSSPVPLILPWRIAPREVARMRPDGRVAIVTATEAAAQSTAAQWLVHGVLPELVVWAAAWRPNEVVRAMQRIRDSSAELVILDGGARETLDPDVVQRQTGKRVVTLLEVAARAAAALLH